MKKNNIELAKLEQLFNEAIELIDKGLIDASLMYSRKIIEGMFLVLQNEDKLNENNISFLYQKLYSLEKRIKNEHPELKDIELFFRNAKILQELGTHAVHYTINETKKDISKVEIKNLLTFVFEWFKMFIQSYDTRKVSKDLFFDKNNDALPLCIKYVEIQNFQTLKNVELIEIPVDSRFVVFTGDNGEGKTSILQAIAIGMYGDYDENSNLILSDKQDVNITIEAKNKKRVIFNEYRGFLNQFTHIETNRNLVAYGASRLQIQSNESQDVSNTRQSNVYGIFKTDNILLNIEYWIKIQKLNGQEKRINAIQRLLIKLLPSIDEIKIGHQPKNKRNFKSSKNKLFKNESLDDFPITYVENGIEIKLEQLSAGNKSILAMIGDMIIRLYNSQSETIEPEDLYGVVLIDELETHLHPKWQKEFPKLLTDNFPLIQFFVSTHSAIVFLGMPHNSVFFNVAKNNNKETIVTKLNIDIENIMPHQILTSTLFGMNNLRNIYNKGIEYLNVETELEIHERLENEKILKNLSNGFKFELPKE